MSIPSLNLAVQGGGAVSADQLNTYAQGCTNMANLRAFVGSGDMKVYVGGFTVDNDGGQGMFYWNASGTATDDNGVTTVVPNGAATGCWTRFGSSASSTIVNSVSNVDGSLTISPTTGNVVASLGSYPANTALANATAISAQPTGVALTASTLLGRASSGNITAIPFSTFSTVANFNAITGCLPTSITGTNTTAGIVVSSGLATDSSNTTVITCAGYSWAVSNGVAINGYSGGTTLPNSSTIHIYLCIGTNGTGLYGAPNLITAPSAPVGYNSYIRRIFSFNTNSSGAPIPYTAIETEGGSLLAWLTTQILDISVGNLGSSRTAFALTVPAGIKVNPIYRAFSTTGNIGIILTSGDETDIAPSTASNLPQADLLGNASDAGGHFGQTTGAAFSLLTTNTSGQIGARATTTSVGLYWTTRGFKDFRRN